MSAISTAVPNYQINMITENSQSALSCTFKITKIGAGTWSFMINKSPTGNCQLTSLGYVNYLLYYTENNAGVIRDILVECFKMIKHNCKLALIDVNEQYIAGVESCFNIVTKQPYTSTNGSKMCHFLVKFSG
jgi:hypothetical protein